VPSGRFVRNNSNSFPGFFKLIESNKICSKIYSQWSSSFLCKLLQQNIQVSSSRSTRATVNKFNPYVFPDTVKITKKIAYSKTKTIHHLQSYGTLTEFV